MGALMQLYDVRPGIQYAVSKIAQRQEVPRDHDMEALRRIVLFLWYTRDMCLRLRCGDKELAKMYVRLRGFSDCGYANHLNGRSQYSTGLQLVDADHAQDEHEPINPELPYGMFTSKSWMPPTVDLSTCECEAGTLVELTKDVIMCKGILDECHLTQYEAIPLYNDNESTRILATSYSGSHKRVRYMLPRVNWLMEQTKAAAVKFLQLSTDKLPADLGTKLQTGSAFKKREAAVMGY